MKSTFEQWPACATPALVLARRERRQTEKSVAREFDLMTICEGSMVANGRTIKFEGGPALRFVLSLRCAKNGPVRTRVVTFKEPALSLAAAFWAEKNLERKFKYVSVREAP